MDVMDVRALALELHDAAFTWNSNMLPLDSMEYEQRKWFMERAERMIAEGWRKSPDEGEPEQTGGTRRPIKRGAAPSTLKPEDVRRAVQAQRQIREGVTQ